MRLYKPAIFEIAFWNLMHIWYGIIYNSAFPKSNSNAKQILHAVTICIGKEWQISKIIQWIPFSIYISTKKTRTELSWKIAHVQVARVFIELDRLSIEVKSIKSTYNYKPSCCCCCFLFSFLENHKPRYLMYELIYLNFLTSVYKLSGQSFSILGLGLSDIGHSINQGNFWSCLYAFFSFFFCENQKPRYLVHELIYLNFWFLRTNRVVKVSSY